MSNKVIVCSSVDKITRLSDEFYKKFSSVNRIHDKVHISEHLVLFQMINGDKFCFTDEYHHEEYKRIYDAIVHVDTTMEAALAAFDPTPTSFTKGSRFLLGVLGLKSKKEYLKEGDKHE